MIEIDLKKELLATTSTSFARLLQLGTDAMALYMFYLYTSNNQDNQSVYATTGYCQKGLNWSKNKVIKNKKILEDAGWVESITKRNVQGVITGHYVKVKYRVSSHIPEIQRVDNPEGGKQDTNTPLEREMHPKKEISSFPKEKKVFNWQDKLTSLQSSDDIKNKIVLHYIRHKNLTFISKEEWKKQQYTLFSNASILAEYKYKSTEIQAMFNYADVKYEGWTLNAIAKNHKEIIKQLKK